MLFSEVAGQEKLKNKLRQSVSHGRVAHAQMLVGPVGTGSLPLALAFAQYLACGKRTATDSCGSCPSCKRYKKLEHPDLQLIFPKNKTDKIDHKNFSSKDFLVDWRSAVIANPYLGLRDWLKGLGIENKQGLINVDDSKEILHNLSYKAYEAEYRIVLIWLAENMNPSAANKLLKVLEEPPEKTVFLLVTEDAEQLIATIQSRVQAHRLERLDEQVIADMLQEENVGDEELVQGLAHMADGDLTLAKDLLLNKEAVSSSIRFFINWMRACFGGQMDMIRNLGDEFHAMGREQQKGLLQNSMTILRKVLMYRTLPQTKEKLLQEELEFVQKFSRFITPVNSVGLLEELNKASYHIERNANGRIVFIDLSFQVSELLLSEAMK